MERGIILTFDHGTLLIEGALPAGMLPDSVCVWDARVLRYRATALARRTILQQCARRGLPVDDRSSLARPLSLTPRIALTPRPYQDAALATWLRGGACGTVMLPTGAGKTCVALQAIGRLRCSTLVVVPTLDLLQQWYALLRDVFGMDVGVLGGGTHALQDLTVTTYDSAYLHMARYGNRFDLLIFDEVHHLPAPSYRQIPLMSTARYRLGLTATYLRADDAQAELDYLIGPLLYRATITELAGEYLAGYEIVRLRVRLTEEEATRYAAAHTVYREFLHSNKLLPHGAGWQEFIARSAIDPAARAALLAAQTMRRLVAGATRKWELLDTLLRRHPREKVLIFTEYTELVYRIAEDFLIPAITHQTPARERKEILDGFRGADYSRIVTSKVLNEGVDVPAAKVGIMLGGSASPREYTQRLGRLLRKGDGTSMATLYEVVTSATTEVQVSARRRRSYADA
jgi:superfamily II DNA or RNA helicase